jgi:two-component system, NarL family, sensor histidine kinase DesK
MASVSPADVALGTTRRARIALVAVHVPTITFLILNTTTTLFNNPSPKPILLAAVVAIGGLQLHLSLATAQGRRPQAAIGSWVVLLTLAIVVMISAGYPSFVALWFVGAAGAMAFPGRWGAAVFATAIGTLVVLGATTYTEQRWTTSFAAPLLYFLTVGAVGTAGMYAAARMVPVVDELFRTRAELSAYAVHQERRRFSRDLHDVLGQGLSAIALKGDLARALLADEPARARRETQDLIAVADSLLRDLPEVTHADRPTSFANETRTARQLLRDAGIELQIDDSLRDIDTETDTVLGWAVREGTTNALRHSAARQVQLRSGRTDGRTWLELVNDRPLASDTSNGSGLVGLADRARALGGSLISGPVADSWRLRIEIPEDAT